MKVINTDKLNRLWQNGVIKLIDQLKGEVEKIPDSIDVLDTKEEIEANTDPGKMAGALAVKEMVSELDSNLNGYSFGETTDGKPGYRKPGADAVTPFSNGNAIYLGAYASGSNVDVKAYYSDYENLTSNDFIVGYDRARGYTGAVSATANQSLLAEVSKSYNANSGVLTINISSSVGQSFIVSGASDAKIYVTLVTS